ncbi:MAG: pitrilysin family protein [Candidatus Izemoplasmatales bacterium]|nr:pitrilysin family protein [Candidatus Izemoplasmatales bacterium]NLF49254.1 insulinase family protein [Acholeplasmataceae bacterium]
MIERTVHEPLHETIIHTRMRSGLDVVALPKPGFSRKAATLLVPFGSIDNMIVLDKNNQRTIFPEGTAHFLEHMLFENTQVDMSRMFSLLGASVNAYTTFNRTAFYFSTTNGIEAPLKLLFDMLMKPDFSLTAIEKERAIIEKEIDMYQDEVEQSLFYDLMNGLYWKNPIRNDIAGRKESLYHITSELLQTALRVFYHPKNMLLVLSGDFPIEETFKQLEQHPFCQKKPPYFKYHIEPDWEENRVHKALKRVKKDLRTDLVMLGIKIFRNRIYEPLEAALEEMKMMLLMDNYLGSASAHQEQMQKAGLINNTFEISVSSEATFSHVLLFTETKKADLTIAKWKNLLALIRDFLPNEGDFIAQKQKIMGSFVQLFDSVTQANALLSDYYLKGINLFDLLQAVDRLEVGDLLQTAEILSDSPMAIVHYYSADSSANRIKRVKS